MGSRPQNEYDVFYVDFGDREWVTSDRIVPAWNSILQLPLQAIECSLVNVGPLGKVFYKTNCEPLKQGVLLFNRLVAVFTAFFRVTYLRQTNNVRSGYNYCHGFRQFSTKNPKLCRLLYIFVGDISNTRDNVSPHFQTLRRETKLGRAVEYLVCGKTLSLEFNISSQAELKLSKKLIEESKKYMQIEIRYPIPSISPVQSDCLYMSLKVV